VAFDIGTELIAQRAGSDGEGDLYGYRAASDLDITHHSELDDVGAELRVDDARKGRPDGLGGWQNPVGGSDG
jgi:hypothetical protein